MKVTNQPDVMAAFELDDPARRDEVCVPLGFEAIWLLAVVGSRKIC
jgi:hypothetical protein